MRLTRAAALAALLLAACGTLPSTAPQGARIVCLVPSVTEIVFALGAGASLVGNTNQCDFPDSAKSVYKVGDFMNPGLERILVLKPTLVVLTLPMHRQLLARMEEMKLSTYVSRPTGLAGVFAEIESVGGLVGRSGPASELVARMRRQLDSLPSFSDTPRVFVEISSTPLMTAGGGTFINGLVERAGGRNVFGSTLMEYPVIDPEAVVRADPQVILLLHPDIKAPDVAQRVGWGRLAAVRSGRVHDGIDEDLLFRPGPRVVDGIVMLSRLLHFPN